MREMGAIEQGRGGERGGKGVRREGEIQKGEKGKRGRENDRQRMREI